MNARLRRFLTVLAFVLLFVSSVFLAFLLNTDFGGVEANELDVPNGEGHISCLLYRPAIATVENPLPGVVLAHGIGNAKEVMSGIALELARSGFVALTIDLVGHGNSDGQLRTTEDHTFGTLAAVQYLQSQPFVNSSLIGLIGHSLGAAAIRATAAAVSNVCASVFIGGGLGEMVADSAYGNLNATFPKNLLIAVGRYDVLFSLKDLESDMLLQVFNTSQSIVSGRVYGSFSSQTARKLVTSPTTHLFEPFDSTIVSETVFWMTNAIQATNMERGIPPQTDLIYQYREVAVFASLIFFIGVFLSISAIAFESTVFQTTGRKPKTKYGILQDWKTLVIWGTLGLALYLPMSLVGLTISVPPLIFGSSIAWWMLATAIVGLLLISYLGPRFSTVRLNLKTVVFESFGLREALMAIGVFVLMYVVVFAFEPLFKVNVRIAVPVFRALAPSRILAFFMFLPFFLIYFFADSLYLHEFHSWPAQESSLRSDVLAMMKALCIKVSPYVAVVCLQYLPMVLFEVMIVPSSVGFLVEFFWLIIPLFAVSTMFSWLLYQKTSTIGAGVILNSLLFAWIAASVFPF